MKQKELKKLVDPNKYQVFILHCPCGVPWNFASHPWFVCNKKGEISRWEVRYKPNKDKKWGHLHLNSLPPFIGIESLPFTQKTFWQARLLTKIEGRLAKKIIDFIQNSKNTYPYYKNYSLAGYNSNTYAQWVLNHFPEIKTKLPWNSFGKKKI